MTQARVLVPLKITAAMLKPGTTIAEPDLTRGEVAWVSAGNYVVDDLRTHAGSVWYCWKPHAGRTALPENDPGYWLRKGPTNRMAPYDDYTSTRARAAGTMTYVVEPDEFYNGLSLWGLEGDTCTVTVEDIATSVVTYGPTVFDLWAQAMGLYELLYTVLLKRESIDIDDLPMSPASRITITLNAAGGNEVALGTQKLGDWRSLIGGGKWGGVEYGANSSRKNYTDFQENPDGTYTLVPRHSARITRCSVEIEAEEAMVADGLLAEIANIAVVFQATDLPRYGFLNALCFLSGDISADDYGTTRLNLNGKGNI